MFSVGYYPSKLAPGWCVTVMLMLVLHLLGLGCFVKILGIDYIQPFMLILGEV